jgi:aspartate-semialdehyde dehydrogenase
MSRIRAGILGATGLVGQQLVARLQNHPQFQVGFVAASARSLGGSYGDAVQGRWHMQEPLEPSVGALKVHSCDQIEQARHACDYIFSCLESDLARQFDPLYAQAGFPVISHASCHRGEPDVPMLIPEINSHHLEVIGLQQRRRGWPRGYLVVKPNCSLQSYLMPIQALSQVAPVRRCIVSTLQSVSGAGYPGVSAYDLEDNLLPYIAGEEEKSEREPLHILGDLTEQGIRPTADLSIAAHCNRVAVREGHMACVSIDLAAPLSADQILDLWRNYRSIPQQLQLHSAPRQPIHYRSEPNRPQPRLDRDVEGGMAVVVGRLRPCPVFQWRFVGLSHNVIRGAAGGSILTAELLAAQGLLQPW